jgi:hypothetical protein
MFEAVTTAKQYVADIRRSSAALENATKGGVVRPDTFDCAHGPRTETGAAEIKNTQVHGHAGVGERPICLRGSCISASLIEDRAVDGDGVTISSAEAQLFECAPVHSYESSASLLCAVDPIPCNLWAGRRISFRETVSELSGTGTQLGTVC